MASAQRTRPEALLSFTEAVLRAEGVPGSDAHLLADTLVTAELWGHASHGMLRLPWYVARLRSGAMERITRIERVRDTGALVVLDGRNGIGQVVTDHAISLGVERAREYGVSAIGVRNSGHFGTAAYFTRKAAESGLRRSPLHERQPGDGAVGRPAQERRDQSLVDRGAGRTARDRRDGSGQHGCCPRQGLSRGRARDRDPRGLGRRRRGQPDHRPAPRDRGTDPADGRAQGLRHVVHVRRTRGGAHRQCLRSRRSRALPAGCAERGRAPVAHHRHRRDGRPGVVRRTRRSARRRNPIGRDRRVGGPRSSCRANWRTGTSPSTPSPASP